MMDDKVFNPATQTNEKIRRKQEWDENQNYSYVSMLDSDDYDDVNSLYQTEYDDVNRLYQTDYDDVNSLYQTYCEPCVANTPEVSDQQCNYTPLITDQTTPVTSPSISDDSSSFSIESFPLETSPNVLSAATDCEPVYNSGDETREISRLVLPLMLKNGDVWVKIGQNWYDIEGNSTENNQQKEVAKDPQTEHHDRELIDYRLEDLNLIHHINVSKRRKRSERLWEFLLRLLEGTETNPSLIEWVDKDKGMFRLNQSKRISQIWGSRKNNGKMNYEKLSRAMRYYYSRKILQPVYGKKLVYKFGPRAANVFQTSTSRVR